jgi:hypothetical protein
MRTSGFVFSILLAAAASAAAQTPQTPLIALAPPPAPIYGPRSVVPAQLACTDVPVSEHQTPPLHVRALHSSDPAEFSYRDSVVVLNGGTPQGLTPGQRFFTRRLLPPRAGAAVMKKGTGAVHTSGWLTVIAADEHSALARVDYACDAVMTGDFLEPYVEPSLPADVAAPTGDTDFSHLGRVLQGTDRNEVAGAGDMISIDRGASQGLNAGTRVAFYRDRGNGTPLVELGTGIVLEASGNTAKVVVDRARFAINTDDYWAVRRP